MKIFRLAFVAGSAAVIALGGGCLFPSGASPVSDFDLEPVAVTGSVPVRCGVFRNLSGGDRRFMSRRGSEVFFDENNRWLSGPEQTLMRAVFSGIGNDDSAGNCRLDVTIYRFCRNGDNAELAVEASLVSGDGAKVSSWSRRYVSAIAGSDAGAFVAAMDRCTAEFAAEAVSRCRKMMQK